MDHDVLTMFVRFVKFAAVLAYAASVGVALWASERQARRRIVHGLSSPTLLLIWSMGYLLALARGVHLSQAWIVGGFGASLFCHLALIRTTRAATVTAKQRALVASSLVLALWFMTFRPIWWAVM